MAQIQKPGLRSFGTWCAEEFGRLPKMFEGLAKVVAIFVSAVAMLGVIRGDYYMPWESRPVEALVNLLGILWGWICIVLLVSCLVWGVGTLVVGPIPARIRVAIRERVSLFAAAAAWSILGFALMFGMLSLAGTWKMERNLAVQFVASVPGIFGLFWLYRAITGAVRGSPTA